MHLEYKNISLIVVKILRALLLRLTHSTGETPDDVDKTAFDRTLPHIFLRRCFSSRII